MPHTERTLYLYSSLSVRFDGAFTLYDEYVSPMLLTAPSGECEVVTTFNLGGEYSLKLWDRVPFRAVLDISLINSTKRGFDAQFTLGGAVSYSVAGN